MLTTPLVSLSVHEALTFDGTEIVLHPDLFSASVSGTASVVSAATLVRPPTTAASGSSVVPPSQPVLQRPLHRHTQSDTAAAAAVTSLLDRDGKVPSTNLDDTQTGPPSSLSREPSHQKLANGALPNSRLVVGNMIEIRVWDPLSSEKSRPRHSPSGGLRRRPSPTASSLVSSVKNSLEKAPSKAKVDTASTLEAAASSLQMSFPSNSSLQYSVESSDAGATPDLSRATTEPSPRLSTTNSPTRKNTDGTAFAADESTAPSAEKNKDEIVPNSAIKDEVPHMVLTHQPPRTASVPPLFPRSRANTGDNPPTRPTNTSVVAPGSKPPTVQRSRTTQSLPPGTEAAERAARERRRASSSLQQTTTKPKSLHVRDISDMTADTVAYASGAFGSIPSSAELPVFNVSPSDIISGMPSMESGEDCTTIDDDLLSKVSSTHRLRLSFTMLVTEKTLTSIKSSARTQISILRQVADLYSLSSYDMVTITRIEKSDEAAVLDKVSADFVMVTIKDQFISRGDMHYFQKTLLGRWIYEGERLSQSMAGVNAHAREIRHANRLASSGIVTNNTTITFRSRSARIIWLIQISSEMWDYASPYEAEHGRKDDDGACEIYFDKFVRFMFRLFEKWKEIEATHSLTVVFFSRTFLSPKKSSEAGKEARDRGNVDVYGRAYEDHYKTVVENETPSDWDDLVRKIKNEFVKYPFDVGWNFASGAGGRWPSNAMQGNLLEAINVTLNLLHLHYMDRDLKRTGNSIVIVSSGCGVFEVDRGLSEITYQRMMDDGIGSDMLCLGLPPLHIAPFFLYNNDFFSVDTHGVDTGSTYYEVPHWMHLSFASYEKEETGLSTGRNDLNLSKVNTTMEDARPHPQHFQIVANGFLLPKLQSESHVATTSLLRSQSEESTFGNEWESLNKSQTQTRQRALISGREFDDILEACRPKNVTKSIPSALLSLLHMESGDTKGSESMGLGRAEQDRRSLSIGSDMSSGGSEAMRATGTPVSKESSPLTEWGAIDFSDTGAGSVVERSISLKSSNVRGESESPVLPLDNTDQSESSDKSSPSSSFASVYSHMLGKPSERGSSVGSYQYLQPSALGGIQIQRSPSLEFDTIMEKGAFETNMARQKEQSSDESLSTMGSEDVRGEKAQEGVLVPNTSSSSEFANVDYAAPIRALISKRDANFFSPASSGAKQTIAENVQPATPLVRVDDNGAGRGTTRELSSQKKGNLGAALKQYNTGGDETAGTAYEESMKRVRSVGMLSAGPLSGKHQYPQYHDRASRPLSPGVLGRSLGSDPPDHLNFQRHRGPALFGELTTLRTLLTPDGKAIQRLDGVAHRRPSGTHGSSISPSENMLVQSSAQHLHSRPISRNTDSSGRLGTGLSPRAESKLIEPKTSQKEHEAGHTSRKARAKKRNKRYGNNRGGPHASSAVTSKSKSSRQRKSIFNPFREHDEEEVLAKKTHNRRRWSHVFPKGEIEFKRHAGPNWRSLCQPAILPLTIDVHPSPQELRDRNRFYFNHYSITLSAIDQSYYTSNAELLLEMVRQRVTQDFQIVPPSVIRESTRRGEAERKAKLKHPTETRAGAAASLERHSPLIAEKRIAFAENDETIQHTLSMGHKIHELTYQGDSVDVIQYYDAFAMHDTRDVYHYRYHLYSETTKKYSKVVQKFEKYPYLSRWSKVDNIICGDSENLSEEMRYRRISFGLIPERFEDEAAEKDYVDKFSRLLEYLSRLRQTEDSSDELDIRIVTGASRPQPVTANTRTRGVKDTMRRFVVNLRRGRGDRYEWMEIALGATFHTRRSYRIMINWLVASASKVETQIQLLHRRCSQYGLKLVSFPELSTSENVFLYPFMAPPITTMRDAEKAELIDDALLDRGFVDDGVHKTAPHFMDCVDRIDQFEFPLDYKKKPKSIPGQQYVHRSGALFIRVLRDLKGRVVLVALENTRHLGREDDKREIAMKTVQEVWQYVDSLTAENKK